MSLAAGDLNRKITISKPGATKDASNQVIPAWEPVFSLWAKILGANGMSAVRSAEAGIALAPGKYSFRIRYRLVGIDTSMRVEYQGLTFNIIDVRHDLDRHEYTDLVCETGANDG